MRSGSRGAERGLRASGFGPRASVDPQRAEYGRPDGAERAALLGFASCALELDAPGRESDGDVREAGAGELFLRGFRLRLQAFELEDHLRLRRGAELRVAGRVLDRRAGGLRTRRRPGR